MLVCRACGVAPPLRSDAPRDPCRACATELTLVDHAPNGAWARFLGRTLCGICGGSTSTGALPLDGRVTCLHCDGTTPFSLEELVSVLKSGHDSVEVTQGLIPRSFKHPAKDLLGEAHHEVVGEWELRLLPGVPLCRRCSTPLVISRTDVLLAECTRCDTQDRYLLLDPNSAKLAAVIGDEHRVERPARVAEGADALLCSSCGGPLPASRDPLVTCTFCGTTSRLPLRARAAVQAADAIWVLYEGLSEARVLLEATTKLAKARALISESNPPEAPSPAVDEFAKLKLLGTIMVMVFVVVGGMAVVASVLGAR